MIDTTKLITILTQGGSFIAAFAAIAASIVMFSVTKKFGTGIMAQGFQRIAIGVLFIALGIILDAINSYIQINSNIVSLTIIIIKEVFFVIGTYIIVIGSKKTGDKLESL